jgi:hypothetical protein
MDREALSLIGFGVACVGILIWWFYSFSIYTDLFS